MNSVKPHKLTNWPNISMAVVLIINLIIGMITLKKYGMSWDEPLFYNYANSIGYAYSISARLDGTFDLNKAYGISPDEHKQYGPAYLLIATPIVDIIERLLGFVEADAWHIVNFLTFQIGVLFFYFLSKRWMRSWAAFFAAGFFATQPLLWGHGFINPKDTPFLVFFIISVYWGFRMVDSLKILPEVAREKECIENKKYFIIQNTILAMVVTASAVTILLYAGSRWIMAWVENLVRRASTAPASEFLGIIYHQFAPNADGREITPYINKALTLFSHARIGLLILTVLLVALAIFLYIRQKTAIEIYREIRRTKVSTFMIALAGICLGLTTSIRVLGPLAGLLIAIYLFAKHGRRTLGIIILYGVIAILVCYLTWPYIWAAPITGFFTVLHHMSENPAPVSLLFNGVLLNSHTLPITYMPTFLVVTLTEPVWPLFVTGIVYALTRLKQPGYDLKALLVPTGWFFIPFLYVIIQPPSMYDGIRHFIFILPGVFLVAGMGFQALIDWIKLKWVAALLIAVFLLPGMIGILQLSPYEYAYYNIFTGGLEGAFRKYETDYWLLCYKETFQYINETTPQDTTVYVLRNPTLARTYAAPGIHVEQFQREPDNTTPGSLLLLTTRANVDLAYHADAPVFFENGRAGAIFCVVKRIK